MSDRDERRGGRGAALAELVLARWRVFYREPGALFWSFGFPLLMTIALGIAFRNRPPDATIVAVARGPRAEETMALLAANKAVRARLLDPEAALRELSTGRVSVVIEPGATRTYRFDPTRPESRTARLLVDDVLQRAEGRVDKTPTVEAEVSESGSRYVDFLLPGLIGMNLLSSGLWGVGYTIADMRARKLIKRMIATPMKKADFLLAFVLVRALFLVVELPVLVGFGRLAFGVPMRGSALLFFAVATIGSLAFAGLGVLVASRSENTQTVNGLISFVTMPMFVLSGVFFSTSRFPGWMQPVLRGLPLTALNDALRMIMLEGAGLAEIAAPLAVVIAWGAVSFVIALKIFRWR